MRLFSRGSCRRGRVTPLSLTWPFNGSKPCPTLITTLRHAGGRTQQGRRSIASRGALSPLLRTWATTQFYAKPLRALGVVLSSFQTPRRGAVYGLVKSVAGFLFYVSLPAPVVGGDFFRCGSTDPSWCALAHLWKEWPRALKFFPPYTALRFVASRFAKAHGSTTLLLSTNIGGGQALLRLPSGRLRLLSIEEGGLFYHEGAWAQNPAHKGKAGFWRTRGWAPVVRGTVKNPNDHPNGGRTRALKCPLTPWGSLARRPRQPRRHKGLKALAKRLSSRVKFQAHMEIERQQGRALLRSLRARVLPAPSKPDPQKPLGTVLFHESR